NNTGGDVPLEPASAAPRPSPERHNLHPVTTVTELLGDLDAEYGELHTSVSTLSPDGPAWDLATPAQGWAVRDQISHLAFFDDAARMAVTEPDVFIKVAEEMMATAED